MVYINLQTGISINHKNVCHPMSLLSAALIIDEGRKFIAKLSNFPIDLDEIQDCYDDVIVLSFGQSEANRNL